jgi:hypothetical protein
MIEITPTLKLFTKKDNDNFGIHINNLVLEHNGDNYQLHGGTRGTIHVFTQSERYLPPSRHYYVITGNHGNTSNSKRRAVPLIRYP